VLYCLGRHSDQRKSFNSGQPRHPTIQPPKQRESVTHAPKGYAPLDPVRGRRCRGSLDRALVSSAPGWQRNIASWYGRGLGLSGTPVTLS